MGDTRFRDQNDAIRKSGNFGPGTDNPLFVTPGVQALGDEAMGMLYTDVMTYDSFTTDMDPDNHRDMGALNYNGTTVWFKIDQGEKPDLRIFTLLLPEEW